jgi:hypothetical protein
LLSIAREECKSSNVLIVCNTSHDKYNISQSQAKKLSSRSLSSTPSRVIKDSVLQLYREGGSRLNSIGRILDYVNYAPIIVLRARANKRANLSELNDYVRQSDDVESKDFVSKVAEVIVRAGEYEISIDLTGESFSNVDAINFLQSEQILRRRRIIKGIDVLVVKPTGEAIPIEFASSGELTLISTLTFIMTNIDGETCLLIDEPENSLHPRWQKEYVRQLADLTSYFSPKTFIATHAPILLSGAQATLGVESNIFFASNGQRVTLGDEPAGLEDTLWNIFDTVTPANHFLSEELVREISSLDNNVPLDKIIDNINSLREASYDPAQGRVFDAAIKLATEMAAE